MKTLFYLSSCSTCAQIMDSWQIPKDMVLREIKTKPITEQELEQLYTMAKSYEALFSKRALLYKSMALKDIISKDLDYKKFLLQHYTFLKRPVLVCGQQIFIGNAPRVVALAKAALHAR